MKRKSYIFAALAALMTLSCSIESQKISLQDIKSPDPNNVSYDEYYVNLREWKESDHIKSYVYFAAWAPPEGATSLYITYSNSAKRLTSLPDSLDIVNLWMGVPSNDPNDEYNYSPYAYSDMQYCRKQKGTKFVMHADASHDWKVDLETGDVYNASDPAAPKDAVSLYSGRADAMEVYAQYILDVIYNCDIDGVDIDYEGWSSGLLTSLVNILSRTIGPQGEDDSKLLIVDYFGGSPSGSIAPKINYLVKQAYSQQGAGSTEPASSFSQPKMIYCEQYNQDHGGVLNYTTGGYPKGNYDGRPMYSLESYARDCVSKKGGGFGAYYIDNDFFNDSATLAKVWGKTYPNTTYDHYAFLRHAISIANPVGAYTAE